MFPIDVIKTKELCSLVKQRLSSVNILYTYAKVFCYRLWIDIRYSFRNLEFEGHAQILYRHLLSCNLLCSRIIIQLLGIIHSAYSTERYITVIWPGINFRKSVVYDSSSRRIKFSSELLTLEKHKRNHLLVHFDGPGTANFRFIQKVSNQFYVLISLALSIEQMWNLNECVSQPHPWYYCYTSFLYSFSTQCDLTMISNHPYTFYCGSDDRLKLYNLLDIFLKVVQTTKAACKFLFFRIWCPNERDHNVLTILLS